MLRKVATEASGARQLGEGALGRSRFITNLSWVAGAYFGFVALAAMFVLFLVSRLSRVGAPAGVPTARFLVGSTLVATYAVLAFVLCVSVLVIMTAIALYARREWARRTLVAVSVVGAIGCIVSLVFTLIAMALRLMQAGGAVHFPAIVSMLIDAGLCWFLLWVSNRLRSEDVKEEFRQASCNVVRPNA